MTPKEKAEELVHIFCAPGDVVTLNICSIRNAVKCCQQIIKLEVLTDEAWLNVPNEYKVQYWKEVMKELKKM